VEEDNPLPANEFQRFTHGTPTIVGRNDTHWNPISWWIDESNMGNYDSLFIYTPSINCPVLLWLLSTSESLARLRMLPLERNALGPKVIEAYECLLGGGGQV
jgi:hypothetical protein